MPSLHILCYASKIINGYKKYLVHKVLEGELDCLGHALCVDHLEIKPSLEFLFLDAGPITIDRCAELELG